MGSALEGITGSCQVASRQLFVSSSRGSLHGGSLNRKESLQNGEESKNDRARSARAVDRALQPHQNPPEAQNPAIPMALDIVTASSFPALRGSFGDPTIGVLAMGW